MVLLLVVRGGCEGGHGRDTLDPALATRKSCLR
jgi:hypothetical protein